jgi:hypothetical protein
MPFMPKSALGGERDPNINMQGRIKSAKSMTNRQLRERELLTLLRKLKPHVADAIMAAVKIMGNAEAADNNKLKAATIILDQYKDVMTKVYDKDYDDEDGEAAQENSNALFSLKVVGGDKTE